MNWRQTLNFLRLTDDDGVLSITNIAMYVVLVKLAIVPQATLPDLVAAMIAFASYGYKKYLASKEQPPLDLAPLHLKLDEASTLSKTALAAAESLTKDVSNLKSAVALKGLTGR